MHDAVGSLCYLAKKLLSLHCLRRRLSDEGGDKDHIFRHALADETVSLVPVDQVTTA